MNFENLASSISYAAHLLIFEKARRDAYPGPIYTR